MAATFPDNVRFAVDLGDEVPNTLFVFVFAFFLMYTDNIRFTVDLGDAVPNALFVYLQ
jgi:hypothetical protein